MAYYFFFFVFNLLMYLISINFIILILTANLVLQMAWRGSCRLLLRKCCSGRHIPHRQSLLVFQLFAHGVDPVDISIISQAFHISRRSLQEIQNAFESRDEFAVYGLTRIFPLSCYWHLFPSHFYLLILGAISAHSSIKPRI